MPLLFSLTRKSINMPKSKEQFEQIRNERIKIILNSAATLFALKGYEGVSLDEVTKEAKCSHGLLYHYFSNKEELYKAVLEQVVYPDVQMLISDINWDQKAKDVMSSLLDKVLEVISSPSDEKVRNLYLLMNIHLQKSLTVVKKNEKGHTPIFAYMEELIDRGKKENDFKDYDTIELTISILSLIKGIAFNRVHIGSKRFIAPHKEIIMGMLLK